MHVLILFSIYMFGSSVTLMCIRSNNPSSLMLHQYFFISHRITKWSEIITMTCPTKIKDSPSRTKIDHLFRRIIPPVHIIRIKRQCNGSILVVITRATQIWICTLIKTWWCNGIVLQIKPPLHHHRIHILRFTIHYNRLPRPCHLTDHQSPHRRHHPPIIRTYPAEICPPICAEDLLTIHYVQMLLGKTHFFILWLHYPLIIIRSSWIDCT